MRRRTLLLLTGLALILLAMSTRIGSRANGGAERGTVVVDPELAARPAASELDTTLASPEAEDAARRSTSRGVGEDERAARPTSAAGSPNATASLWGRVTDDLAAPVREFVLVLEPLGSPHGPPVGARTTIVREFRSAPGEFDLAEVALGRWRMHAEARGVRSTDQEFELESTLEEFDLTVRRPGRITGTVVDTSGTPVAAAVVVLDADPRTIGKRMAATPRTTTTDDVGRFAFEEVAPGSTAVRANAPKLGASMTRLLAVDSSEDSKSLRIEVGHTGRVAGELTNWKGEPDAGREIVLTNPSGASRETMSALVHEKTRTDDLGRFVIENLAAGRYALLRKSAPNEGLDIGDAALRARVARDRASERIVDVVEGETAHVAWNGKLAPGVRVRGVVRGAKGASDRLEAQVLPDPSGPDTRGNHVWIDADGRFEVIVDAPGRHRVAVFARTELVSMPVDIPDVPVFDLELALPGAAIGGRVVDPDGTPIADADVTLDTVPAVRDTRWWPRQSKSDADGRFRFVHLASGAFKLRVDVPRSKSDATRDWLRFVELEGVHVGEDQQLEDVELRVTQGGSLDVIVPLPAGFDTASVSLFNERGGWFTPSFSIDRIGSTRISGIPPGLWAAEARASKRIPPPVGARDPDTNQRSVSSWSVLVSGPSPFVDVRAGARTAVTLALVPGTWLRPRLIDSAGKATAGTVRAFADRGRDVGGVWVRGDVDPERPRDQDRIGPLARGRYTLRATIEGRDVSREVVVNGEEELTVELRLGG